MNKVSVTAQWCSIGDASAYFSKPLGCLLGAIWRLRKQMGAAGRQRVLKQFSHQAAIVCFCDIDCCWSPVKMICSTKCGDVLFGFWLIWDGMQPVARIEAHIPWEIGLYLRPKKNSTNWTCCHQPIHSHPGCMETILHRTTHTSKYH